MKTAQYISEEKLRGGFYTPLELVRQCWDRVASLVGDREIDVLEPSVGDGAFIKGLRSHGIRPLIRGFVGVERVAEEATKARRELENTGLDGKIVTDSALRWLEHDERQFDVAVGNPPFVRYQFIDETEGERIARLSRLLSVSLRGVSNLWLPIFLGALSRVRPGGAMAFVVPAEVFTGVSAGAVRSWVLRKFTRVTVDLFLPGIFPGVLQEIVVISGRRRGTDEGTLGKSVKVNFVEHAGEGATLFWSHRVPVSDGSWTQYLLSANQLKSVVEARSATGVVPMGTIARFEVSLVTGANDFFSLSSVEAASSNLRDWVVPLLARIRHAEGLVYTTRDHDEGASKDIKAWFLKFHANGSDPAKDPAVRRYLREGERAGLHLRYKTSIRRRWYEVPWVAPGDLLLSKRSHYYPRVVMNKAGAVTTDTIYRGRALPLFKGAAAEITAGFHNSLTLLSAEIEGRSFGGGVLELVPSEVSRLSVPFPNGSSKHLDGLDTLSRSAPPDALIEATNRLVSSAVESLSPSLMRDVEDARQTLLGRRLLRSRRKAQ